MNLFNKHKKTVEQYFILAVLVYTLISLGIDIFNVISNKLEARDVLNFTVRWLQNILFISVLLTFFIRLKIAVFIAMAIGYIEVEYSLFASYIAPIFITNQSNISPEYARIIFFVGIMLAWIIKLCIKKEKFKDIFLLLSMMGVMGTSILFHVVTTAQLDYFTQMQEKRWQSIYNKTDLDSICKIEKIECEKFTPNIKNELVNNYYENYSVKEYINASSLYFRYQIISDLSIPNRIQSRKPLAFIKNKDGMFYMLDKNNYTEYLKFNETIFGTLSLASHLVWIFGAFYLIAFHTSKKKRNKVGEITTNQTEEK